ncbi:hypothetical protein C5B90_17240 [Haloferax sp. Atlit-12N]|uniref:hypothetical protein n=1 Tax=Haloferax sp. Atlit-12N TaxID=2077203 RepID=UPI000E27D554|nr:hypothetical protein [Haloferax sp. Atlit-12N]RDZ62106.1 hypothetical protein C5B90_17240 [Haloferax sp. Atlit-12N]
MARLTDGDDDESAADSDSILESQLNRRNYLKLGAMAASTALSAGVASAASGPEERFGIQWDRVVNAVDDLGMDPNGNEPIDNQLDSAYESGTLIEFPPGEYLATETQYWNDGVSRFGMVGTGSSHKDVQFVFPSGNNGEKYRFLEITSGDHHVLKNFSIQQTDDDTTTADIWMINDDGGLIEDVEWLGRTPTDNNARRQLLAYDCSSVDGVNVARRVYMREGAELPGYPDGVAGIRVQGGSVGEIRLVDCHIEQRGSSSFRATHTRGVLRVEGGLFKNNDNTNMRISAGDHPSKTSWIKGATVIMDADNLNEHARDGDSLDSPEGLRIDSTGNGYAGVLIEDCDFIFKSCPTSRGIVSSPTWAGHGGFTLRNCRIQNDTSVQTIHADSVDTDTADKPWGVNLENVSITGSTRSQPAGAAVCIDNDRNGSTVQNSCIHFPNGDVDGVLVNDATNCEILDSNINVTGQATVFSGADVDTSNITSSDTCPLPSADGSTSDDSSTTDDSTDSTTDSTDSTTDSTTEPLPNEIRLVGTGTTTQYEFTVTDSLQASGDTIEEWDDISGGTATGWITTDGVEDAYTFSGDIDSFSFLEGECEIYVNGEQVTESTVTDATTDSSTDGSTDSTDDSTTDSTTDSTDLSHELRLVGTGTQTQYEFTVSDALEASGDTVETWDTIDGTSASGWITTAGVEDTFNFAGSVTSFSFVEGEAEIYVDGEQVTESTVTDATTDDSTDSNTDGSTDSTDDSTTDSTDSQNELRLVGTGAETQYEVTVSGTLEASGDTIEQWDDVSESSATGWVTTEGAEDTFTFTGTITSLSFLQGEAEVYVNGTRVDPAVFSLPNTLVVDGDGTETTYEFMVSGDILNDPLVGPIESDDSVTNGKVKGSVTDNVDAFRFSGDIRKMNLTGDAALTFEDNDG